MTPTHCPYCHVDTTAAAFVHPETKLRYCTLVHADAHVGVARWYRVAGSPYPVRAADVRDDEIAEPAAAPAWDVSA